jgi:hypothetical protein
MLPMATNYISFSVNQRWIESGKSPILAPFSFSQMASFRIFELIFTGSTEFSGDGTSQKSKQMSLPGNAWGGGSHAD